MNPLNIFLAAAGCYGLYLFFKRRTDNVVEEKENEDEIQKRAQLKIEELKREELQKQITLQSNLKDLEAFFNRERPK